MAEYVLTVGLPEPVLRYVTAHDDAGATTLARATVLDEFAADGVGPGVGVTLERRDGGRVLADTVGGICSAG